MVIKPLLFDYLLAGRYPGTWRVVFRQPPDRAPDGWFHPSSAPMMGERQLYLFLTQPGKWEREPMDYVGRFSTFVGSAMGDFLRMALEDMGITIPPKGTCVACGLAQPRDCPEHGVIDAELGARGHVDGLLEDEVFELKTTAPLNLSKAPDMDQGFFAERWPQYYGQVTDYMRMTGYTKVRVLMVGIGNPWEMREYLLHYDQGYGEKIAAKYRAVRRAEIAGQMPEPCCAPGSPEARSCPATGCPVRQLSLAGKARG
jgi:hypothetical protein